MLSDLLKDIEISTVIAICSVLVVLPIQLLLCFKVKRISLKLVPLIILTLTTVFLFIMMRMAKDWDAIGYAILFVFSGVLALSSLLGWVIWGIVKLIKKIRRKAVD